MSFVFFVFLLCLVLHSPCYSHSHILTPLYRDNTMLIKFVSVKDYIKSSHILSWWITGTCFIQKIYAPSSSLLQDKYLPLIATTVFFVVEFVLFVLVWCPLFPMLPVSLDCQFLIAPTVFFVMEFVLFVLVWCLLFPMLPVSLDCQFLIAPTVFFVVKNWQSRDTGNIVHTRHRKKEKKA
jgi:hypothetical protein